METLAHGVAGSVGGRFGHGPSCIRSTKSRPSCKLQWLEGCAAQRLRLMDPARYPPGSNIISPLQNLVLSCLAGVINVFITNPLWVANMRLKSKDHAKYTGVLDCLQKIARLEGLSSLWNGTMASLILVSNPVIHYVSYERMKTAIQLRRQRANGSTALSALEIFVLGALAKSFTTVVTYPLQVAQSLMRVSQKQQQSEAKTHERQ
ncbi:hypothetical protein PINS_up023453 [Pythium insidiosum]|nr:hypothetical protein PINS_up023453 [Pythium insidiosum]